MTRAALLFIWRHCGHSTASLPSVSPCLSRVTKRWGRRPDPAARGHRAELAADVFVILDSCNWAVGQPAFTTTLRGLAACTVEVRTLDHALHSGVYGGVVPDALTALCRMLATLHDDEGNVAVAGLATASAAALEYPAERLRAESGIWMASTGSAVDRLSSECGTDRRYR